MKLKLSDWASIAEIVSGIAVVATLVILILSINENTLVTRASAYDRNIDALNSVRLEEVHNREVARRWIAFEKGDPSGLDDIDRKQLEFMVSVVFQLYEKAYFNHQYGVLGDSEWTRYQRQICVQSNRVVKFPDFQANLKSVLTDEFTEYVASICDNKH